MELNTSDSDIIAELKAQGCGRRLGRFTVARKLATGGMAEVYIAFSESLPGVIKRVAIKKIRPQFANTPRFVPYAIG